MNSNRIRIDIVLSVFIQGMGMLIGLVYTPLLVKIFGESKYGVWVTLTSIITWIDICDIGIGNGLRNTLTEAIARRENTTKQIVSTAYIILSCLSLLLYIISLVVIFAVNWNTIMGYDKGDINLTSLMLILQAFVAVNFVLSLCKSIFYSIQKTYITKIITVMISFLMLGVVFIFKESIDLYSLSYIYGIVLNLVPLSFSVILFYSHPELRPSFKLFDPLQSSKILRLGIGFFFIQFATWIINQTDSILIASRYGSASVTPFNLINKIMQTIVTIAIIAITPIWSGFTAAMARQEYDWMKRVIRRFCTLFLAAAIMLVITAYFIPNIIYWWTGVSVDNRMDLIVQCCGFSILRIWCSFFSMAANGMNLIKENGILAVIQSILNIPLSIILAGYFNMGIAGIILGSNIVMIIGAIYLPILVITRIKHRLNMNTNLNRA